MDTTRARAPEACELPYETWVERCAVVWVFAVCFAAGFGAGFGLKAVAASTFGATRAGFGAGRSVEVVGASRRSAAGTWKAEFGRESVVPASATGASARMTGWKAARSAVSGFAGV